MKRTRFIITFTASTGVKYWLNHTGEWGHDAVVSTPLVFRTKREASARLKSVDRSDAVVEGFRRHIAIWNR